MTTYQGPPAVPGVAGDAATDLVAWARAASAAHSLALSLVKTAFCPSHFRDKPEDAAAAILYGSELHLSPLQALNGIYMIGGKPALYAKTLVAVVLSKGHRVWTTEKTDTSVTVRGLRQGTTAEEVETWTIARATTAGYTRNAKYRTDPQAMLLARAQSDVCRRVAPDALLGMAYSVEELQLEQDDEQQAVAPSRRRGGRVVESSLTKALAAPPAPAVVEEHQVVEEPTAPAAGDDQWENLERARGLRDQQAPAEDDDQGDADDGYLPGWEPGAPAARE
jgi:hypothetical protein